MDVDQLTSSASEQARHLGRGTRCGAVSASSAKWSWSRDSQDLTNINVGRAGSNARVGPG
jgi:hypothetical protein